MDFKKYQKYIELLYMDGLNGRMLRMPASIKTKREILIIYGHHSSLERMATFAEVMTRYGSVTMPDLPGFGGMESFYKQDEKPTLDNYADYMAAFIKLRFKRKKAVVVGISFGIPIITRMLQKYPELEKRIEFIISLAGFSHKEDIAMPKKYYYGLRLMTTIGSRKLPSLFFSKLIFRPTIIKTTYKMVSGWHAKMKSAENEERDSRINFEVELWAINDLRTYMYSLGEILTIDICYQRVNVAFHHISPKNDMWFKDNVVEQHLRIIYEDFKRYETPLDTHAPSIVATVDEINPYIPKGIHKLLAS